MNQAQIIDTKVLFESIVRALLGLSMSIKIKNILNLCVCFEVCVIELHMNANGSLIIIGVTYMFFKGQSINIIIKIESKVLGHKNPNKNSSYLMSINSV